MARLFVALLCFPVAACVWCPAGEQRRSTSSTNPRFAPTEDRALTRDDAAQGDFTVNGRSVPLRHAYATLGTRSDEPSKKYVSIVLTNIPVETLDDFDLDREEQKARGLHYVKISIDDEGEVMVAKMCHADLGPCFSMATLMGQPNIRFEREAFAGHQVSGRLYTARPENHAGATYTFSAQFKATLWEITGRHLGLNPSGSFGVERGRALGSLTVDGQSFNLAHAYARPDPDGMDVLLTATPISVRELKTSDSFRDLLQGMKGPDYRAHGPGLRFIAKADGACCWSWNLASVSELCKFEDTRRQSEMCGAWNPALVWEYCEDCPFFKYAPAQTGKDSVAGTVYGRTPMKMNGHVHDFKVTFHASLTPSSSTMPSPRN